MNTLRTDFFIYGFNDEARRKVLVFIACIAVFGVGAASPSNVGDDGGVIVLAVRKRVGLSLGEAFDVAKTSNVRSDKLTKRCMT